MVIISKFVVNNCLYTKLFYPKLYLTLTLCLFSIVLNFVFFSRSKTEDVESALIEDEDELQSKKKKGKKEKKKKGDIENEEDVSEITKDVQELSIKGKREKLKVIKYILLIYPGLFIQPS